MAKENVFIHIKDISSQTSLNKPDLSRANSNGPAVSPGSWPSEPVPLNRDTLSTCFNVIYDGILIVAPILLILKVALVFRAFQQEKSKLSFVGGAPGITNPTGPLTEKLMNLNDQVRSFLWSIVQVANRLQLVTLFT
jgi:hypothetical protein